MSEFIQVHMLTSYPPANLNRDELGRPKTAVFGTTQRLRVSSQSLKRAWRTSDVFVSALAQGATFESGQGKVVGIRTKDIGNKVHADLIAAKVDAKQADEIAKQVAARFGKPKSGEGDAVKRQIEQLAFVSVAEMAAIKGLVSKAAMGAKLTDADYDGVLLSGHGTADIAMFGRMLADKPAKNVEAACQVAHAISVHKVTVEDDYYSAVDDLNNREEDVGAGHLGTTEFAAGLFYLYICIDRTLLLENLDGDEALCQKTIAGLLEAACIVSPSGKQNSFASRERAHYVLVEKGDEQPRSLSVSFLHPLSGNRLLIDAVKRLDDVRGEMNKAYGVSCREAKHCAPVTFDKEIKAGVSFADLVSFAAAPPATGGK